MSRRPPRRSAALDRRVVFGRRADSPRPSHLAKGPLARARQRPHGFAAVRDVREDARGTGPSAPGAPEGPAGEPVPTPRVHGVGATTWTAATSAVFQPPRCEPRDGPVPASAQHQGARAALARGPERVTQVPRPPSRGRPVDVVGLAVYDAGPGGAAQAAPLRQNGVPGGACGGDDASPGAERHGDVVEGPRSSTSRMPWILVSASGPGRSGRRPPARPRTRSARRTPPSSSMRRPRLSRHRQPSSPAISWPLPSFDQEEVEVELTTRPAYIVRWTSDLVAVAGLRDLGAGDVPCASPVNSWVALPTMLASRRRDEAWGMALGGGLWGGGAQGCALAARRGGKESGEAGRWSGIGRSGRGAFPGL